MMPSVFGGGGESQNDEVGARECFVETLRLNDDVGSVHGLHPGCVHRDVRRERCEQPQERLGDPSAAENRDASVEQVTARGGNQLGPCCKTECRASGPGRTNRELRHRLGVDAFATRPCPVVVDDIEKTLDSCVRSGTPSARRARSRAWRQARPDAPACPTPAPRPAHRHETTTAGDDRIGHPRGEFSGARAMRGALLVGM